jgi:hypothetical protein
MREWLNAFAYAVVLVCVVSTVGIVGYAIAMLLLVFL